VCRYNWHSTAGYPYGYGLAISMLKYNYIFSNKIQESNLIKEQSETVMV